LQFGAQSRRLAGAGPGADVAARTTGPTPAPGASSAAAATTGVLQFTMAADHHLYTGGELETGTLGPLGSNFGGAYGVLGTEHGSTLGSISLEVVAGAQWTRADFGSPDVTRTVVEPRVRGQLWLAPQLALGAMMGTSGTLGDGGWMAGLYLGVYSKEYNVAK
jgi:hypothetical protein